VLRPGLLGTQRTQSIAVTIECKAAEAWRPLRSMLLRTLRSLRSPVLPRQAQQRAPERCVVPANPRALPEQQSGQERVDRCRWERNFAICLVLWFEPPPSLQRPAHGQRQKQHGIRVREPDDGESGAGHCCAKGAARVTTELP